MSWGVVLIAVAYLVPIAGIFWEKLGRKMLQRALDICSPSGVILGTCTCSSCKRWRSGNPHGIRVRVVRDGPRILELPP